MFDDERAALHDRIGRERGERVFVLVVALDTLERNKAAGLQAWEKPPPPGSADDVRAELRRVLELPDTDLLALAAIAEDAARHVDQAYPRPSSS
jgi:hypothetical protein